MLEIYTRGESDRGIVLLTGRGELIIAHASAGARSRRRFGGALQPGARVRARWTLPREGAAPRLDEATLMHEPPAPDPLERYYAAAHLLELGRSLAREGAEDPRLFRLLCASLERLDAGDAIDPLLRYVEAWVLALSGLLPEWESCTICESSLRGVCRYLALDAGVFCAAHRPAGALSVRSPSADWLRVIRSAPPDAVPALPAGSAQELADLLAALIVHFLERPLKALPALAQLRSRRGIGESA